MPSINNTHSKQDYKWIILGDIHDDITRLNEIPKLKNATGVIISGDLTFNGGVEQAEKVICAIKKYNTNILAQIGNMDKKEITVWLKENKLNLHTEVHELTPEICILGVGASTLTPFATPSEYPESKFTEWLDSTWQKAKNYQKQILISHNPPKDTLCDVINGGIHVGSTALREFIEKKQPTICICGHIHEACNTDYIRDTLIINPGNFAAGGYVILYIIDGKISAELKHL